MSRPRPQGATRGVTWSKNKTRPEPRNSCITPNRYLRIVRCRCPAWRPYQAFRLKAYPGLGAVVWLCGPTVAQELSRALQAAAVSVLDYGSRLGAGPVCIFTVRSRLACGRGRRNWRISHSASISAAYSATAHWERLAVSRRLAGPAGFHHDRAVPAGRGAEELWRSGASHSMLSYRAARGLLRLSGLGVGLCLTGCWWTWAGTARPRCCRGRMAGCRRRCRGRRWRGRWMRTRWRICAGIWRITCGRRSGCGRTAARRCRRSWPGGGTQVFGSVFGAGPGAGCLPAGAGPGPGGGVPVRRAWAAGVAVGADARRGRAGGAGGGRDLAGACRWRAGRGRWRCRAGGCGC